MFLYHLRDLQLAALAPWRIMALATERLLRNPLFPLSRTESAQRLAEHLETFEKKARLQHAATPVITQTNVSGDHVRIDEKTIEKTPFCRLLHYKRIANTPELQDKISHDPRVLIVAPYSGRSPLLLADAIRAMLPGHDLYFTLWADAKAIPTMNGPFDLEDQIALLARFMRNLGPDLHVVAISQGSLPALCATALLAEADKPVPPRSLTLIGGPIDSSRAASPLSEVALTHPMSWFKETRIELVPAYYPGAFRSVYPGFMRLQNRMPMTADKNNDAERADFNDLVRGCGENEEALKNLYDAFLSVMDIPAELYLQYVSCAFQKNALAAGVLSCKGKKINLASIRETALMSVEAELDDQSPPGQTRAANDLCSGLPDSMKRAHLEIGVGHYGIFIGRKWRNNVQPAIQAFIRAHNMNR